MTGMNETIAFAHSELVRCLKIMDPCAAPQNISLSVDPSILPPQCDKTLDDRFEIKIEKGHGYIKASNHRSVLLGVYAMLRKAGCRFIRPGKNGEFLPSVNFNDISIDYRKTADYRYRGYSIEGAVGKENVIDLIDWMPKMGFNLYFIQFREAHVFFEEWYTHVFNEFLADESSSYTVADSQRIVKDIEIEMRKRSIHYHALGHGWIAESIGYSSTGWHKADNNSIPNSVRPLLAEINGKREFFEYIPVNTQLCYSNPDVQARLADEVVNYATSHPEKDLLHFWLADNFNNTCECSECRKKLPTDYYVQILNKIDQGLTEVKSSTKIGLLLYYDLLWAPQSEEIINPNRFMLIFAPAKRSYLRPWLNDGESLTDVPSDIAPFERNDLKTPTEAKDHLPYLFEWQKKFSGECVVFDYHMMWDIHKDYSQMRLAKIQFRDIQLLKEFGLSGYISCQLTRSGFPTGLCNYLLGIKLFDSEADYDLSEEEYFAGAFGQNWKIAKQFLRDMSNGFLWEYSRGETAVVSAETAQIFKQTPAMLYHWKNKLNDIYHEAKEPVIKESWFLLTEACEIYAELAIVLFNKASGVDMVTIKAQFELLRQNICRREERLKDVFDLCSFILIVNTIIKKAENEAIAFDEKI